MRLQLDGLEKNSPAKGYLPNVAGVPDDTVMNSNEVCINSGSGRLEIRHGNFSNRCILKQFTRNEDYKLAVSMMFG